LLIHMTTPSGNHRLHRTPDSRRRDCFVGHYRPSALPSVTDQ
jgi:hypothetical protein